MSSLVACVVGGVAWCFCTAAGSLLGACCGNDKASTVAPGSASGRKRSVLLLIISVAIAFGFQYGIAAAIVGFDYSNYVTDAWLDGCDGYETDILIERCAGQAGVYRSAFSATLFFALAAIAVACKPTANREAWPAKFVLFLFLVLAMCFVPNDPLFNKIYLNIARIGGILFIFVQQIILVDLAYNWNDSWVGKADAAEAEEAGSGKKWLMAIIISAAIGFVVSIIGWGLLIHFFAGCTTNTAFISVTIVFCIVITAAQLSGVEGSLLSSSVISIYATSLCYSAVSKNPDGDCNPFLGEDDPLGILIGVGFTVVSLGYAGWSCTADKALNGDSQTAEENKSGFQDQSSEKDKEKKVTGVVTNDNYGATEAEGGEGPAEEGEAEAAPGGFSNSWKLNVVLGIVSCWYAMALTGWGSIKASGGVANPEAGEVSMWMIIASQWLALSLYLWTLVAPRLFPNREFS